MLGKIKTLIINYIIMKKPILLSFIIFLSSCSPYYYQVQQITPTEDINKEKDFLIYENTDCKIIYDFWSVGGNITFTFINKTEENIYLNLSESFLIINGYAHDYYKNREYSYSESSGQLISSSYMSSNTRLYGSVYSSGVSSNFSNSKTNIYSTPLGIGYNTSTSGSSFGNALTTLQSNINTGSSATSRTKNFSRGSTITLQEEAIICIPAKSRKTIARQSLNANLYRSCDILLYPKRKVLNNKLTFTKNDSPTNFTNIISYTIGRNSDLMSVKNNFYVSEIQNLHQSDMLEYIYPEDPCNKKPIQSSSSLNRIKISIFKDSASDKFYIRYPHDLTSKH